MKRIGYVLVAAGIGLLIYLIVSFVWPKKGIITPVPDDDGVKVIYITPGA